MSHSVPPYMQPSNQTSRIVIRPMLVLKSESLLDLWGSITSIVAGELATTIASHTSTPRATGTFRRSTSSQG